MDDSERDDSKRSHGLLHSCLEVGAMVFNATFNNISAISLQSVLLVEETGELRENQTCCKSLTNFIT